VADGGCTITTYARYSKFDKLHKNLKKIVKGACPPLPGKTASKHGGKGDDFLENRRAGQFLPFRVGNRAAGLFRVSWGTNVYFLGTNVCFLGTHVFVVGTDVFGLGNQRVRRGEPTCSSWELSCSSSGTNVCTESVRLCGFENPPAFSFIKLMPVTTSI
jgi:hypothetical protein